jgi:putative ABC transport system permease protein
MQPAPPARYRLSVVERFGLAPLLSPAARMMLRHLERRPLVTGLSVLGLALGAAVMVLGMFVGDAVSDLGDFQFTEVQRFDRTVTLVEPHPTLRGGPLRVLVPLSHADIAGVN